MSSGWPRWEVTSAKSKDELSSLGLLIRKLYLAFVGVENRTRFAFKLELDDRLIVGNKNLSNRD